MAFLVDRVKIADCPHCGHRSDISDKKPLSVVQCPQCKGAMTVPVKCGSMLLTSILGQGTGSIVYEAVDRVLGRTVALKVMKEKESGEVGHQDGLEEARSLLLIDHPNIVKVYAIDTRRGAPCIIMERLTGGSLKDVVDASETVTESRALQIAIDVTQALLETANRGILHLDVKPGNIMFDENQTAKLMDFGFASIDPDEKLNEILGTPYYVSPELIRQLPPDPGADMYSLGATLFHLLCNEPPFEGETIKEILLKRLNTPPPDMRQHRPDLQPVTVQLVSRLMAEDREDRFANHEKLLAALKNVASQLK